jgi:hypothetical protein
MAVAVFKSSGNITGLLDGGSLSIAAPDVTLSAPVLSRIDPLNLASGDNTLAVPVGATVLVFTPPAANTQALRSKGNAADVGVGMHKTRMQTFHLDASGDDVIINAAGVVNGCAAQFA